MPKRKLSPVVRKALLEGTQLPQIGELVSHFMAAAGGPKELAKMLLVEFHAAKPGSIIRQRILDSVLRMTGQASEQMGGLGDMDLLSPEDLERELHHHLASMPDDGEEEAKTDAAGRPG